MKVYQSCRNQQSKTQILRLFKRQWTYLLVIPLSRRRISCPTEEATVDKIDKSITQQINQSINQSTAQSTLSKNCQSLLAKQNDPLFENTLDPIKINEQREQFLKVALIKSMLSLAITDLSWPDLVAYGTEFF